MDIHHPKWCDERWCAAWTDREPHVHRSHPHLIKGRDDVWYSVFLEADQHSPWEPDVRLLGEPGPLRTDNWWEPTDSNPYIDAVLCIDNAKSLYDALGGVLDEHRNREPVTIPDQ